MTSVHRIALLTSLLLLSAVTRADDGVFLYQGQLKLDGIPITGNADIKFFLFSTSEGGEPMFTNTISNLTVERGLFTARVYLYQPAALATDYWLEACVRYPAGVGAYICLSPRQQVYPAPFAWALPGFRTHEGNVLGGRAEVHDNVIGATVSGGGFNLVSDDYGSIGGGGGNVAGNETSPTTDATYATVGGGESNNASAGHATIAGGKQNEATGAIGAIGGGEFNAALGRGAAVPGGSYNSAGGDYSFAAGTGAKVRESDYGTFVWADTSGGSFSSTGPNQFLIRSVGGVGINTAAPANALSVNGNANFSGYVGIGTETPLYPLSVNGAVKISSHPASYSLLVEGLTRFDHAMQIGSGSTSGVIGAKLRVSDGVIALGHGAGVLSSNSAGTALGAGFSTGDDTLFLLAGGIWRVRILEDGKVGLGVYTPEYKLDVDGQVRSRSGGFVFPDNTVQTSAAIVNQIWSQNGSAAYYNDGNVGIGTTTPQDKLEVSDGIVTLDSGPTESITGVRIREAGDMRWTLLYRTWEDDDLEIFNEMAGRVAMVFKPDNKVGIGTPTPSHPLQVGEDTSNGNGAYLTAGGVWTNASDRATKRDFKPVDKQQLLARLVALPITSWRYNGEADSIRHVGPMAQDFSAAFHLGQSDRHIGTIDADGVALAAIQALHEVVRKKDDEIDTLKAQVATLGERMRRIEAALEFDEHGKVVEKQLLGNDMRLTDTIVVDAEAQRPQPGTLFDTGEKADQAEIDRRR